jgi:hypothetical protein
VAMLKQSIRSGTLRPQLAELPDKPRVMYNAAQRWKPSGRNRPARQIDVLTR